jgi:dTDP-4-amino-4,6-dideoxygalactose transaminase
VGIFPQPDWSEGACWLSGITMPNVESAESLRGRLKENNIEAKPFWKPIHLQPMFLNSPATEQPVSSDIWGRIVILPCSTGLMESEQAKVISTIQKILH